jgi:CHAT domain-containing protein
MKMLLAAVPKPCNTQYGDLPATVDEVRAVAANIPAAGLLSLPADEDALRGDTSGIRAQHLLDQLPQATILHLACHCVQDQNDPLKSGFVMADKILTIESLMSVPLPGAFLAFLSACETAKGDKVNVQLLVDGLRLLNSAFIPRDSLIRLSISPLPCYSLVSRV